MRLKLETNGAPENRGPFICFNIIIILAFSLIFARLWYLQVVKGDYFKGLSENNRVRIQEVPAPRGILYDRQGTPLVSSVASFDVSLFRQDTPDLAALIPVLSQTLSLDPEKLKAKIDAAKGSAAAQNLKIKTDISREELARLETRRLDLPGVIVDVVIRRNYPSGPLASHVIGYLGEINSQELELEDFSNHKMGYIIGKSGIEQEYELELMGESGGRQYEVNALGRKVKVLGNVEPNPGNNVFLTLDIDLQKTAEEAMEGKTGALVAMNPQNGDILALTSKPGFDPNLFARGISPENWKRIAQDPDRPLQNRAIQGQYPPGSIFKIITAIGGLEEGVITPDTTFPCSGVLPFGNREYHCWKKEGHGRVNLRQAIVESCDVYFYQLGLRLGVDRIAEYARKLGLGSVTGYPLGREKPGLIPTSSWKAERFKVSWQAGETLSTAIGQGFNLVTPLQIAAMLSAIANGGQYYQPRLVESVRTPYGETLQENEPAFTRNVNISAETLEFIREALWGVVNSPGGTGGKGSIPGYDVAGKTGTAQVIRREANVSSSDEMEDHAWFAGFAPAKQPEIVVVVLIEHGGHGGSAAAPIARKVMEAYFQKAKKIIPGAFNLALQNQGDIPDPR